MTEHLSSEAVTELIEDLRTWERPGAGLMQKAADALEAMTASRPDGLGEQGEGYCALCGNAGCDLCSWSSDANLTRFAELFCATPLPDSVCSDRCASIQGYPHRIGTNLLTVTEAKQVFGQVFANWRASRPVDGLPDNRHDIRHRESCRAHAVEECPICNPDPTASEGRSVPITRSGPSPLPAAVVIQVALAVKPPDNKFGGPSNKTLGEWLNADNRQPGFRYRNALRELLDRIGNRPACGDGEQVERLVAAAREVAFGGLFDGCSDEQRAAIKRLDAASEAFAGMVPWEDEPRDPPEELVNSVASAISTRISEMEGDHRNFDHLSREDRRELQVLRRIRAAIDQ